MYLPASCCIYVVKPVNSTDILLLCSSPRRCLSRFISSSLTASADNIRYNFDTSRRCSGCREVCFCSEECALAGWKRHKKRCKHGGKLSKKKKKKKKEEKDQKKKKEEEEEEEEEEGGAQDAQEDSMSGAAGGNGFSESKGEP